MSHYPCLVILPAGCHPETEDAAEGVIADLIAPYDENLVVEPYQETCWCVGWQAQQESREAAGDINAIRNRFQRDEERLHPQDLTAEDRDAVSAYFAARDARWATYIAPYDAARQAALAVHPLRDAPNPTCDDCGGTGMRTTTYNPSSKWDWWVIGGRWDGDYTADRRNVFPLTDMVPGWSVFAIVTPDGQYHAEADMGWWAITTNENPAWTALQYEIASAFPDHTGVVTDWHI
jgi:hypothetical protein